MKTFLHRCIADMCSYLRKSSIHQYSMIACSLVISVMSCHWFRPDTHQSLNVPVGDTPGGKPHSVLLKSSAIHNLDLTRIIPNPSRGLQEWGRVESAWRLISKSKHWKAKNLSLLWIYLLVLVDSVWGQRFFIQWELVLMSVKRNRAEPNLHVTERNLKGKLLHSFGQCMLAQSKT